MSSISSLFGFASIFISSLFIEPHLMSPIQNTVENVRVRRPKHGRAFLKRRQKPIFRLMVACLRRWLRPTKERIGVLEDLRSDAFKCVERCERMRSEQDSKSPGFSSDERGLAYWVLVCSGPIQQSREPWMGKAIYFIFIFEPLNLASFHYFMYLATYYQFLFILSIALPFANSSISLSRYLIFWVIPSVISSTRIPQIAPVIFAAFGLIFGA